MSNKAILVVSFGTTYLDTLKKNIENLENKIAEKHTDYKVFRAFTSKIVMKKLAEKGIFIPDVTEALEKIQKEGFNEVIVFPTHIMSGFEYDKICRLAKPFEEKFQSFKIGNELLCTMDDIDYFAENMISEYPLSCDEAMIFVGHGTEHHANILYSAINYMFFHKGHSEYMISTVEGFPDFQETFADLAKQNKKKVKIAPLLLVAGDHATNDIAGDEEDSLKMQLKSKGYEVEPYIKGLGEYEFIIDLYLNHLEKVMNK